MRMKTRYKIISILLLFSLSGMDARIPQSTPFPNEDKNGQRILMIGDSNTEIGNITMPLKSILDSVYGNYGTGYCTFNSTSMGKVPDSLLIQPDSSWITEDMRYDFKPAMPPYYSPDGLSISSTVPGATVNIRFAGNAVDIYYLQHASNGRFSIEIDGIPKGIVQLNPGDHQCKKISYENLAGDSHWVKLTMVSGHVVLLGLDARKFAGKKAIRSILHKWGNAWASTAEFINIEKKVFDSALKELDPNKIVILLGTNDHNLDHRGADGVKNNLKELVSRIKKALPTSYILIASTLSCKGVESENILPGYLAEAFPGAAKESSVAYWDLNKWFGPYSPEKLPDGVHVNEQYGKQIAFELFRKLR